MAKSKLVFGVTRIVPKRVEALSTRRDIAMLEFVNAYEELRRVCPGGDLIIHLSIEADTAAEVGVKYVCNPPESIYCGRADCPTCRVST